MQASHSLGVLGMHDTHFVTFSPECFRSTAQGARGSNALTHRLLPQLALPFPTEPTCQDVNVNAAEVLVAFYKDVQLRRRGTARKLAHNTRLQH